MDEIEKKETTREDRPSYPKRKLLWLLIVIAVIALVVTATIIIKNKNSNPLPKSVVQSVSFPLYYPSELPEGYKIKKDSINVQNSIVFYSLENGDQSVTISEQSSPELLPDLKSIPSFGELPSSIGQAGVGTVNGQPAAIVITDKTMINITGSKTVSREAVVRIVQAMAKEAD